MRQMINKCGSKINIKEMLNSDVKTLIEKYYSKKILYTFLIYLLEDSKKYYDHKENPKVLEVQNRVIELLGDLLLGKKVSKEELEAAYNAAKVAAHAAANAAHYAANAAHYAAYAAYYAAYNVAYAAYNATNAAYDAAKEVEYKNYLIELILKENNIDTRTYRILYSENKKSKGA